MARTRTILVSTLVAACATGFALAVAQEQGNARPAEPIRPRSAAPKTAAPPPDPARMDELLRLWEGQSAKLKSLEVSIYRIDKDAAWHDEEHFIGMAAFQNPDLAYVDYRKVRMQAQADPKQAGKKLIAPAKKKNGELDAAPFETILCTGKEVWHYRWDVKQIAVYTLDVEARRRALQEGPLPFLFNLRAEAARQRYDMLLHSENKDRYLVMIRPRIREDKEVFSTAWISLDRQFLLPTRIVLILPDGKSKQDFVLSRIQPNKEIAATRFQGVNPGKGWKLERNPGARAETPSKGRPPRRQAEEKTARRPDPNAPQPR